MKFQKAYERTKRGVQLVTFRLGADYYGIHVSKVREILRPLDLFPVPGMGGEIEGVINLRGEIIPIMKMSALLEVASGGTGASKKRRMIIIDASCGSFGFFVDEVLEVSRIQNEEMQAAPDLGTKGRRAALVTGIVKASGRMVVCLDSEKLIPDDLMAKELSGGG